MIRCITHVKAYEAFGTRFKLYFMVVDENGKWQIEESTAGMQPSYANPGAAYARCEEIAAQLKIPHIPLLSGPRRVRLDDLKLFPVKTDEIKVLAMKIALRPKSYNALFQQLLAQGSEMLGPYWKELNK